jgi:hypothetical protein
VDAAFAASAADRQRTILLTRSKMPPIKRRNPRRDTGASFGKLNLSQSYMPVSTQAGQRACRAAARRVADLERRAEVLGAVGLREAAGRLQGIAAEIRAEVLA